MTAKEFLEGKTLTSLETVDSLIFNLVIGEAVYGLNVDTSNIEGGTPLIRTDIFTIVDDVLTANNISVDLNTIDML
jgi:hypothetical protein